MVVKKGGFIAALLVVEEEGAVLKLGCVVGTDAGDVLIHPVLVCVCRM